MVTRSSIAALSRLGQGARWNVVLTIVFALTAALGCLIGTVPLLATHHQRITQDSESRVRTLLRWMADEVRHDTIVGTLTVAREPGVMTALVLSDNGHVVAPASRAIESYPVIPGLDVAPGRVTAFLLVRDGHAIHVAQPVFGVDGERVGVGWITTLRTNDVGAIVPLAGMAVLLSMLMGAMAAQWLQHVTEANLRRFVDELHDAVFNDEPIQTNPLPGTSAGEALRSSLDHIVGRVRKQQREAADVVVPQSLPASAAGHD